MQGHETRAPGSIAPTCACFMLAQARVPASISQSSTPNAYTSAACAGMQHTDAHTSTPNLHCLIQCSSRTAA